MGLAGSPVTAGAAAALIAIAGAAAGLRLTLAPRWARRMVPFSAGLLSGLVLFGILPELAHKNGWTASAGFLTSGLVLLWAVGRWLYPVCPACSHTHDHSICPATLHGFALPLLVAAGIHAFLDGVGIAASAQPNAGALGGAVLVGVSLHKIPEGIALGVILHAALGSRAAACAWCAAIQALTPLGAAVESAVSAWLGLSGVSIALGLAAGSFLYLAYHAVHADWQRRGTLPVLLPALIGIAGAALLQRGLEAWLH
ncbi:MAG: ZIP family metal transporter [Bryobacterales bacterium]|nr:ZIP family metal transporter [Bryobacteraceae bacterium]MDW8131832.1 ZIP family metal transporter [Bryobacterales bacterium]